MGCPTEPGSFRVAVFARDLYGGESTREIPISVTPAEPPTLGEFVVKGIDTDLLTLNGDVWHIFRGRSCSIECVVLDGEGPYTYAWTADQGTLTADGAVARWDAPESKGPATILVNVTDMRGNTASGGVLMNVETCTCKFS